MIGEAGEDVLEHAHPIEHLDPQLHRIAPRRSLGVGVPAHGQAAFHRHLTHVGAVLAVNCDAVVAQGHRGHDRFAGQGAAATAVAIVETLQTQNRTGGAMGGGGRRLGGGRQAGRHLFIGEGGGGGGVGQPQLLPQPVDHLLQGDAAKAQAGQQVFCADQVATPGDPQQRFTIKQGIEAVSAQLPLQHLAAPQDVFIAVTALIPMADAIARCGSGYKIEPVKTRVGRLGG